MLTRRTVLSLLPAVAAGRLAAAPGGLLMGCQTWPYREAIGSDLDGTLRRIAGDGFKSIELCSPVGYKGTGFAQLASMSGAELRKRIEAAGLQCHSCHFGPAELRADLANRIAWAKDLGLTQMIIASFGLRRDPSMADWTRAAREANGFAEQTQKAGIQLGFHNHDMEFATVDGQLVYDKLMAEFDPKLVKMQFQLSVAKLGYNAADYFAKYPGRFVSMHLQDISKDKEEVAVGQGTIDWKRVFAAAKTAGVKNYFVELSPEAMKASVPYLQKLKA